MSSVTVLKTKFSGKYAAYSLPSLLKTHQELKGNFRQNTLFKLMRAGKINTKEHREKFLAYFQIWSDDFQRAMLLKTALCENKTFSPVFRQHFVEEYGHDQMLVLDRQRKRYIPKDAILKALTNWFPSKMITFNLWEQIVVMNICVEGAAIIFYEYAKPAIDPEDKLKHFQAHGEIDCSHETLVNTLLKNLPPAQYADLLEVLEDTWAMLEALFHRLAELTIGKV